MRLKSDPALRAGIPADLHGRAGALRVALGFTFGEKPETRNGGFQDFLESALGSATRKALYNKGFKAGKSGKPRSAPFSTIRDPNKDTDALIAGLYNRGYEDGLAQRQCEMLANRR
jgi:hypothetical protein